MGTNTKEIVLAALICTLLCIQCNISCLCKFIRVKQCCLTVMELIFFCWVKCHFRKSTVGEVKSFLMFSVHTKRSKGWWDPQGWGGVSDLALVVAWGLFQHCIFSLAIGSEHSLDFAIRFAAHDIFVNWIVQLKFWKLTTRLHKQSVNAFFFCHGKNSIWIHSGIYLYFTRIIYSFLDANFWIRLGTIILFWA